ncbi:MAG: cadmium-translocating P-type ATPase [Oscillospiraceae bacterium]|nr:cadmium-translocating P-type ATPase [Oscillospiraceae bacterium]
MSCKNKQCGCHAAAESTSCTCHDHEEHSACGCHEEHRSDHSSCGCHHDHLDHHEQHGSCSCHSHEESHGCGCGCGHSHGGGKYLLPRIGISAALLLASFFLPQDHLLRYVLPGAAYLLTGISVLKEAGENILHGRVFDECFLMAVASLGALCLGQWQEAAAVMVLYQLGEYLQGKAVDSSRRSIKALMNVRPDSARVLQNGKLTELAAKEVAVATIIEVHPGERIPLDGVVLEGTSTVDQAALTGESLPVEVEIGDTVLAGCVNLSAVLRLRVEKEFSDSAASRILHLVEEASEKKARTEQFITRFARIYTPIVVGIAALLAVLPPLLGIGTWGDYIYRALDFLVVSCPCALVISVPLTYFAGLGCASRNGVLVKGGNYLDVLARVETAAFDKTGTLTEGRFAVTELLAAEGHTADALLELAAYGESASTHPLTKSILAAYAGDILHERLSQQSEIAGSGVSCLLDGKCLLVGKEKLLTDNGIVLPKDYSAKGTAVLVGYDGSFVGTLLLRDQAKADAAASLAELKELGVSHTVLLSGDREDAVLSLQAELGMTDAHGRLLPADKVAEMERLCSDESRKGTILYAGDGINDAPVLSLADVGVAMGGLGTDAAMEAADVVIMGDALSKIPLAIRIARKTGRVAKQNIIFALAVKLAVMLLATLGQVGLWVAVFADVGVCLLAVLNSLRASRI